MNSNLSTILQQDGSFPSAKLKLEQLFSEWVCKEGCNAIYTLFLDSINSINIGFVAFI